GCKKATRSSHLSSSQFCSPTLRTGVGFLQHATENRVNQFRIVNAVIDFESMLIQLRATIRTIIFSFDMVCSYCLFSFSRRSWKYARQLSGNASVEIARFKSLVLCFWLLYSRVTSTTLTLELLFSINSTSSPTPTSPSFKTES